MVKDFFHQTSFCQGSPWVCQGSPCDDPMPHQCHTYETKQFVMTGQPSYRTPRPSKCGLKNTSLKYTYQRGCLKPPSTSRELILIQRPCWGRNHRRLFSNPQASCHFLEKPTGCLAACRSRETVCPRRSKFVTLLNGYNGIPIFLGVP